MLPNPGPETGLFQRILSGLEDPLHVLDGVVFSDAGANCSPVSPFLAEHIVLRVDEHDRGVRLLEAKASGSGWRIGCGYGFGQGGGGEDSGPPMSKVRRDADASCSFVILNLLNIRKPRGQTSAP